MSTRYEIEREIAWRAASKRVGTTRVKQAQWLLKWMEQPIIPAKLLDAFTADLAFFIDQSYQGRVTEKYAAEWHKRIHQGYGYLKRGRDHTEGTHGCRKYWEVRVAHYYTGLISKQDATVNQLVLIDGSRRSHDRYDDRTVTRRVGHGLSFNSANSYFDGGAVISFTSPSRKHSDNVNEDVYKALQTLEGLLCKCPRSDCQEFFIRVRRQRYCSIKCSNKTRIERFRAKTL
jgi:hypothetical protein